MAPLVLPDLLILRLEHSFFPILYGEIDSLMHNLCCHALICTVAALRRLL